MTHVNFFICGNYHISWLHESVFTPAVRTAVYRFTSSKRVFSSVCQILHGWVIDGSSSSSSCRGATRRRFKPCWMLLVLRRLMQCRWWSLCGCFDKRLLNKSNFRHSITSLERHTEWVVSKGEEHERVPIKYFMLVGRSKWKRTRRYTMLPVLGVTWII